MFSVKIGKETLSVQDQNGFPEVNGETLFWDIEKITPNKIHLIHKNKSIEAELVNLDKETKTLEIRLGTKLAKIQIKDRHDLLLEKLGMNNKASSQLKEIKAPMPGLILEMKVKPGDTVKKGDIVLILEAMKMENIIKSPGDGVVKGIKVELNQSVEKNQVLIQF